MNSHVTELNPSESKADKEPYNIVICSDGTWSRGGSATPTNVWRTYLATDPVNQAKFHDDGVGSGGSRVARIIGGAFGYGISRNIEELLVELALAWRKDAKIYLFGFSRGAYTVRIIANLICMYGVARVDGKTPEELRLDIRDMIGAYKRDNELRSKGIFDAAKTNATETDNGASRHAGSPTLETIRQKCHYDEPGDDFKVHFLGCWDTVGALGIPFEPIKQAVTQLFPLKFQDRYPGAKIKHLYQALAIDEERHTFHPIEWQMPPNGLAKDQILEQVWFPGCHSHVGGSYPKDQLALEALEWMLEKAGNAGLRLQEDVRNRFRDEAFRHGQLIDSRAGLSKFYRYYPREISKFLQEKEKSECRVHSGALERVAYQTDGYTPRAVDVETIHVVNNHHREKQDEEKKFLRDTIRTGADYLDEIRQINRKHMQLGRLIYFIGVAILLAPIVIGIVNRNRDAATALHANPDVSYVIRTIIKVAGAAESVVIGMLESMSPGFIDNNVFQGLRNSPGVLAACGLAFLFLMFVSGRLQQAIANRASAAWHKVDELVASDTVASYSQKSKANRLKKIGWFRTARRWLRSVGTRFFDGVVGVFLPVGRLFGSFTQKLERPTTGLTLLWFLLTATVAAAFIFLLLPAAGRGLWNDFHGYERHSRLGHPASLLGQGESQTIGFPTESPFHPTGLYLQKGEQYCIEVLGDTLKWKDLDIDAGPSGLTNPDDESYKFWLRISPDRPHFELLASIDNQSLTIPIGSGKTFTASESGQLFLFVNDVPGFFENNQGKSSIRITHVSGDSGTNPGD